MGLVRTQDLQSRCAVASLEEGNYGNLCHPNAVSPSNPEHTSLKLTCPIDQEPPRVKGLDLGELMKDVGLDLEGFDDPTSLETSQADLSAFEANSVSVASATVVGTTGSQLLAQIQQPLPMQV